MSLLDLAAGLYGYWTVVALMATGLYIVVAYGNLIKKLIGLGIFQFSVFTFFILMGHARDAVPPVVGGDAELYANPLPHVMILTAIVVGVSTMALGLALVVRINRFWGEIDEDRLKKRGHETD